MEDTTDFEISAQLSSSTEYHAVMVVCQGLVGFMFRNVSHVALQGLTFNSCGKRVVAYTDYITTYGLSVYIGQYVEISNCSFQDSVGTAMGVFYSSLRLRGSNSFTNNCRECSRGNYTHTQVLGGGIYTKTSTLIFSGNSFYGGNSAERGGGIHAENSILNFPGNHSFNGNSAQLFGGGIAVVNCILNLSGIHTFNNNSAYHYGGGISALYTALNFNGSSTFTANTAELGGGIGAMNSSLAIDGDSTFRDSSADEGGGIFAGYSIVAFSENAIFTNNSVRQYGGGILVQSSTLNFNGNSIFRSNSAERNGGGIHAAYSTLHFTGNSVFKENSAGEGIASGQNTHSSATGYFGGGIHAWYSSLRFTGNITFRRNSAGRGGGFSAWHSAFNLTSNITVGNNSATTSGGGFYAKSSTLKFATTDDDTGPYRGGSCSSDTSVFISNSVSVHGGAMYTGDSTLSFERCNIFSGNSADYYGGGIHADNSTLKFSGDTMFISNSGRLQGGGINGLGSSIYFSGNTSFTANTASRGGGEYLANSFNFFSRYAILIFDGNNVTQYGGAVYVEDYDPVAYCFNIDIQKLDRCFFQIEGSYNVWSRADYEVKAYLNIQLQYYANHAQIARSAVYGGVLNSCIMEIRYDTGGQTVSNGSLLYLDLEVDSVSSDPYKVLLCEDGIPNLNTSNSELVRQVYPGELLHFPVVAAGQGEDTTPAVIRALFNDPYGIASLAQFQDTQNVKKNCTELYYQMHSSATKYNETLVLYADGPCSTDGQLLRISLQFLPCPPGFSLNSSESTCDCEPRLQKYTTECNITKMTITREGMFWVGYDNHLQALILQPHCPFDYCRLATDRISFPLNNTDLQCENKRSGILCGKCKSGLSLALGSSKCLQCSNLHVLLIIPFALAGIALVVLLLACRVTVAAGTINGLIFYANIVTVNRAIFFPPNETNILTVFIAWLNLDLGIETCFFDGMDEYTKSWLQFVFPLYVWSLVGLIIVSSEYSPRIARLFGSNPVAVLATLFLLSYSKLLRTIIATFSFTFLDHPDDVQVAVWLYDGNIQYLHGKHIALFLIALLTLVIFYLPYTLLLTVGQWLQAKSNRKLFYWINNPRIKPFLDAYHAPYKDKHRYWTGLLLCLRCILLLVFAFNTRADPSLNLLAISSVAFGLILITRYTGAVYRMLWVDILEASFVFNLGIFAVATYYVKLAVVPVSQAAVAYTSVSIVFATFIGVLLYNTCQRMRPRLQQIVQQRYHREERASSNGNSSDDEVDADHEARSLLAPTVTVVERPIPLLHGVINKDDSISIKSQPLVVSTEENDFSELREPLNLIDTNDL